MIITYFINCFFTLISDPIQKNFVKRTQFLKKCYVYKLYIVVYLTLMNLNKPVF